MLDNFASEIRANGVADGGDVAIVAAVHDGDVGDATADQVIDMTDFAAAS